MNCMKCGREIPEGEVFCPDCLEVMGKYPVAPGTHILLPRRPARNPEKKSSKGPSPEEQVRALKKAIRWLWAVAAVLLAALGITTLLLVHSLNQPDSQRPTGRNFTTAPNFGD